MTCDPSTYGHIPGEREVDTSINTLHKLISTLPSTLLHFIFDKQVDSIDVDNTTIRPATTSDSTNPVQREYQYFTSAPSYILPRLSFLLTSNKIIKLEVGRGEVRSVPPQQAQHPSNYQQYRSQLRASHSTILYSTSSTEFSTQRRSAQRYTANNLKQLTQPRSHLIVSIL